MAKVMEGNHPLPQNMPYLHCQYSSLDKQIRHSFSVQHFCTEYLSLKIEGLKLTKLAGSMN